MKFKDFCKTQMRPMDALSSGSIIFRVIYQSWLLNINAKGPIVMDKAINISGIIESQSAWYNDYNVQFR